jgi:hypothetical protein
MTTSKKKLALIFIVAFIILVILLATFIVRPPAMRYYLTVKTDPADIVSIPGEGFYDKGTNVNLTAPQFVPNATGVNGHRYRFANWTVDGQTPMTLQITVHMDANRTAIAHYVLQYYLSMSTNFGSVTPGSGWHDAGSTVKINATAPSVIVGERYIWHGWTGTGNGNYTGMNNATIITMNSPITQAASWTHQFLLTIKTSGLPSAYPTKVYLGELQVGNASDASLYTKWFDAETPTGTIGVDNMVSGATGTQYLFIKWVEDSSTNNIRGSENMTSPKTFTAEYKTQDYLTVTSPYGSPTPTSGWFDNGTSITASVTSPWPGSAGTRYVCTGWTGTGSVPTSGTTTSVNFTINAPSSITWNWKTQYYLTVRTDPLGIVTIPGEGWYDALTTVPLTARSVDGYYFLNWDVDGVSQGAGVASITLSMNMSHTATAHFTQMCMLTITTTTGGTTNPSPEIYAYTAGSTVSVTAFPNINYILDHWELDGIKVGSVNPYTVFMNQDHTLKAVFVYSPTVGGYAAPIDIATGREASPLLASQIGLAFALLAAMVATILLTKRRSKTIK